MTREELVFVCCSDVSGKLRGKAIPAVDFDSRCRRGVGWTPTNVQITCFDTIAPSPYGAFGDTLLMPAPETRLRIDRDDDLVYDVVLANIRDLDGDDWTCCTRTILQSALDRLRTVSSLSLYGAVEHEFQLSATTGALGEAYTLSGFRAAWPFGAMLAGTLRAAGIVPETIMHEYGAEQFEVTVKPSSGVTIADHAVLLRDITQVTAERCGKRATFTPLRAPGAVGNGVHIHLSFRDHEGQPAGFDRNQPHGVSAMTGAFIAGILRHLPSIVALTAPSAVSYQRLVPHRWSAAFNNLGLQDREAAVRLCPITTIGDADPARQFNFEFRASDAAASPHLQLAALVYAGIAGIEAQLPAPAATQEDLSESDPDALARSGISRLPKSLGEALDNLDRDDAARSWFPDGFIDIYLAHKRDEIAFLDGKDTAEMCALYSRAY